jgi:NAD(P)-dependent dehydrogenase (short-subunit alcohol dehydrogenase family)
MNSPCKAKHALVTGSTRGIGRAIAEALLLAGSRVVINGWHHPEDARASLEKMATIGPALLVLADVTEAKAVRTLVRQAVQAFGPIDYLVHTVGVIQHKPWHAWDEEEWAQSLRVNLTSGWLMARESVPWMADGGSILFLASTSAHRVEADALPYSAAKAGLLAMARGLAMALAPRLRVNVLSPGYITTGFDPPDRDHQGDLAPLLPLRRFGTPREIARAALGLLENSFLTGSELRVDGGESLL